MEQIANAEPQADFAKLYRDLIHDQFADVDKDELIRKLIWLQLKDSIEIYQHTEDLNAGYDRKEGNDRSRGNRYVRLFINLGEKDGLNEQKLLQFIVESTDVEPNTIDRMTVRDMSSFFNVPGDAAEYIIEHLSNKKFKGRKVRLEEAEQRSFGGGGGESRGTGRPKPQGARFSGDVKSYGRGRDGAGGGGGYKGKRK